MELHSYLGKIVEKVMKVLNFDEALPESPETQSQKVPSLKVKVLLRFLTKLKNIRTKKIVSCL